MRRLIRSFRWLVCGLLAGASLLAPRPGHADEPVPVVPAWLTGTTLNTFASTSWSHNLNNPDSRTNQFRVFDVNDKSIQLDVLELALQHPASKPRESGFRVDATFGSSIPHVTASSGLFRDAGGQAEDFDLQQAYFSYVAPLGSGLRFDAGKFVTPVGIEVIEGYDGWNENATHSFLFGYAIPFAHVGVRANYAFTPRVSVLAMLVNGWDVATDNNGAKSVGAQLALTPLASLTMYFGGIWGPERSGENVDGRTLLDFEGTWKPTSRFSLGANADWATEPNGVGPGQDAEWSGVAGYARVGIVGPLALCVRGESFADPDGVRTGTSQFLSEITVTPELRVSPRIVLRVDGRIDQSNRRVFEKAGGLFVDHQSTVLVNALYAF
jgi:hypothetical protein